MVQIFPYKFHNPQYKLHFIPVTRTKYDENSRMFETDYLQEPGLTRHKDAASV